MCSLGSWSAAKASWIHSSLFRVFVFGKKWLGQARTVRSRKTFPAGFTPEGLGKGGPDRPGQRFVLESIPVFNNHSLGVYSLGFSFSAKGLCWLGMHSLGYSLFRVYSLRFFGLRPKVRAQRTLRVFVFGQRFLDSHSLGSSSLGKSGPDRPGSQKHFLLDSLLKISVFGKRWPGQARPNTGQDNRTPGQPGRTAPNRPGQRFRATFSQTLRSESSRKCLHAQPAQTFGRKRKP